MSETQIERGCCGRGWQTEHLYLPYQYEPVSQYQTAQYAEQGLKPIKSFTGEKYTDRQAMPHFIKHMTKMFGLYDQKYEFIRARPLDIAPPHNINVNYYLKKYQADKTDVWHTVVMMENWQSGQYIEINGQAYATWKEGEWFKWKNTTDSTFSYANFGQHHMYMMHVTGKNTYSGQLNDLFAINWPGINEKLEMSHPFFANSIIPEVNPTRTGPPCAVYMDNGYIKQLDDYDLPPAAAKKLQEQKLDIYLFEVMCSYYEDATGKIDEGGTKHTQGFYSEFSPPYDYEKLRADELDSILAFHRRHNLEPGTITVHTGEYNIEGTYPYYEKELNLVCDDLYLRTQRPILNLEPDTTKDIVRHFVSLNWRFTKHRQLVANFLAGENGHLSWYFKNEFDVLNMGLWFDLEEWEEKYPSLYQQLKTNNLNILQKSPFVVDKYCKEVQEVDDDHFVPMWPNTPEYAPGQTPSMWNTKWPELKSIYEESFVDIVTETRFAQPTGNYSEKVLQAIQYKKPFILVAPPHTLKYLKESGYQTFDNWWNEDYDECEDHGERLAKIFTIIQSILIKPAIELHDMYQEMLDVVNHNHKLYHELTNRPNWNNTQDHG